MLTFKLDEVTYVHYRKKWSKEPPLWILAGGRVRSHHVLHLSYPFRQYDDCVMDWFMAVGTP